jgi:hypothetical protein
VTNQESEAVTTKITHHAKQRDQALGIFRRDLLGVIHVGKSTFVRISPSAP